MDRTPLLADLADYSRRWPREPMIQRFIEFVSTEPKCFSRATVAGHVTASAWIVAPCGERVLMLHHKKLDRWLQPGGHADGDPNTLTVACKEVEEEVGLSGLEVVGPVFDLDIHPIPARPGEPRHLHYDVRYALRLNSDQEVRGNDESHALRWFDVVEIADWEELSLARMARKWLARSR